MLGELKPTGPKGLYCGSRLRSGEVFASGGSIQNLKDQKGWILEISKQRFSAYPFYGRARCWPMLGALDGNQKSF